MSHGHTFATFDVELTGLRETLVTMGRLAECQLTGALAAIGGSAEATQTVLAGDGAIDAEEHMVEARVVRLLALRQPMANDLREIITAFKIASDFERIGDLAVSIAKRAKTLELLPALPPTRSLDWMGQAVAAMVGDVTRAYADRDTELALAVRARDTAVDQAYTSLFRELLTYMMESPLQITACTHLMFAAKSLERVGDHATNIAEMVCYLVSGHTPAEERSKDDRSSFTILDQPPASGA